MNPRSRRWSENSFRMNMCSSDELPSYFVQGNNFMRFPLRSGRWMTVLAALILIAAQVAAQDPPNKAVKPSVAANPRQASGPADSQKDGKMPLTGLIRAKPHPNLCSVRYRVSTSSPECQAFFDQGLGYLYSYVWMEASRSFETAAQHDPDCALAWWGLSRALDRWGRAESATKALQKAHDLREHASYREQLLIQARMQEKGLAPYAAGNAVAHKTAATETIDTMISLFDDDEEAWF